MSTPSAPLRVPGSERAREQACEGGEMAHDPRGGWRFHVPRDGRPRSAAGRPPTFDEVLAPVSDETESERDLRLHFAGDAQRPPQALPGTGTQGAWGTTRVLREWQAPCDVSPSPRELEPSTGDARDGPGTPRATSAGPARTAASGT